MYRFLTHPRWIGFALLVLLTIGACLLLASWQWERLDQREQSNALISQNTALPAVTPDQVLQGTEPLADEDRWRTVAVTGRYDDEQVLLVRKRVQKSQPGFYVMTPIRGRDGVALWINRGWIPAAATATTVAEPPPTPAGTVTVTARLRPSEGPTRTAPGELPAGQIGRIDIPGISAGLSYPAYGAFGELITELPATVPSPDPLPPPDLTDGPHLSYAVQWATFALVAVVGWYVLIRKEAERLAEERAAAAGQGPDPDPDRADGPSRPDVDARAASVEGNL